MFRSEHPDTWPDSNNDARLTSPVESPDSKRVIGRMTSQLNLPVPEWIVSEMSAGTEEPVRMNWPWPL